MNRIMEAAIEVQDLTKRYPAKRSAKDAGGGLAVDAISFTVARGSTTALLGGNGAGKTTTLSVLLGLLLPTAGTIRVLGEDMLRHRYRVLSRMNFSSPYVEVPRRLTVEQNLRVYGRLYGVRDVGGRIRELAHDLDIADLLARQTGELSAGQRTRVALAKALINQPVVLLLDEPTASLDPDTGDWVRGYLERYRARSGATILLASHNMAEVERLCDMVLMLRRGRIIDRGSPAELLARYGQDNLEEVFLDIARDRPRRAAAAQ
ncbi:MAG: ABC transporter ATP-binding protein [Proteobacteria bacterium]|nr:ABC transporter ATP-binding protein [Pseudomonadota bacterium]